MIKEGLIMSGKEVQEKVLELADSMAAAATNFKGHGYDIFIKAREELKEFLLNNFKKN
jgi:hypothetical protein